MLPLPTVDSCSSLLLLVHSSLSSSPEEVVEAEEKVVKEEEGAEFPALAAGSILMGCID
jgi:hypothetical protein